MLSHRRALRRRKVTFTILLETHFDQAAAPSTREADAARASLDANRGNHKGIWVQPLPALA